MGPVGYSSERGPSNGLPPAMIWPFRLPAFPEVPHNLSNWVKCGSSSSQSTG